MSPKRAWGWLARWDVRLTLLLSSPVPLAIVLLVIESRLRADETLPYIALIWSAVALGAVIVSGLLAYAGLKRLIFTYRRYPESDSRRLIALEHFIVTASLLCVHTIFLAVGVATVFFEDSFARQVFGRIGLVEGQYILLVMGVAAYLIINRYRQRESHQLESRIEEKVDEAAEVATERHVQYSAEHFKMLEETRDAAIKAAEASRKAAELAEIEQEILDKISRKLGNR